MPRDAPVAVGPDAAAARQSAPKQSPLAAVWHLDVALVLIAAAPALALGAPALGYAIGAGAWIVQCIIAYADKRLVRRADAPQTKLGIKLFEAFGRIWLLAGAIIAAGVIGGRADGLTAALVIFVAYSLAFAMRLIGAWPRGRPQGDRQP